MAPRAEAVRKDWELVVRAPEPRVRRGALEAHQDGAAAAARVPAPTARTAVLLQAKDRPVAVALVQVAKVPVVAPEARAAQDVARAAPGAALWHSPISIVHRWGARGRAAVALVAAGEVEVQAAAALEEAAAAAQAADRLVVVWGEAAAAWVVAVAAARGAAGPPGKRKAIFRSSRSTEVRIRTITESA